MAKSTLTPEERAAKNREYQRQWKLDNPEKYASSKRRHYEANKEKVLAANKQYRELNKETVAAGKREWAKNNPEKRREIANDWVARNRKRHSAAGHQWLRDNPDKRAAAYKRWCEKFPEKVRHHTSKRRITQAEQMPHWVTKEELQVIFKSCPADMHVDHIVPLRGITFDGYRVSGLHVPWNLQYLTLSQNSRKRNRMRREDHTTCGAPAG